MSTHYCGEERKGTSFWLEVEPCEHKKQEEIQLKHACCSSEGSATTLEKDNCCTTSSQTYIIKGKSTTQEALDLALPIASVLVCFVTVKPFFNVEKPFFVTKDQFILPPLMDLTSPEVIQCYRL